MNTDRDDTAGKESACNAGIPSLGGEDPLQEEMATHSSILAWKIPWTEDLYIILLYFLLIINDRHFAEHWRK